MSDFNERVAIGSRLIDQGFDEDLRNAQSYAECVSIEEKRKAAHAEYAEYVMKMASVGFQQRNSSGRSR